MVEMKEGMKRVFAGGGVVSVMFALVACAGPVAVVPGGSVGEVIPPFGLITPRQAAAVLADREGDVDFILLDIRTDAEIEAGHVSGAESLDFYSPSFQSELAQLDRTKTYLIYCRTGNRTGQAYAMMQALGFETVYDMDGGITQWNRLGYPACQGPLGAEHTCSGELPEFSSDRY